MIILQKIKTKDNVLLMWMKIVFTITKIFISTMIKEYKENHLQQKFFTFLIIENNYDNRTMYNLMRKIGNFL